MKSYLVYGSSTADAHKNLQSFLREKMGNEASVDLKGSELEGFKQVFAEGGFDGEIVSVRAERVNTFPRRSIQYTVIFQKPDCQSSVTWGMEA